MSGPSWLLRRWWFWPLAMVALAVFAALTIRLSGEAAWRREQAAVQAGGAPTTLAELAALAPPVDAARQERLWVWWEGMALAEYRSRQVPSADVLAVLAATATAQSRQQVVDYCAGPVLAADLTELSAILDSGPVHLCSPGWLAHDLPRLESTAAKDRRLRGLSEQLYHTMWAYLDRAWERYDPASLRRLDQLLDASRPVASRDDFWTHSVVADFRDQAYLAFHAAGRLPAAQLAGWLQEPSDATVLAASASDGERVVLLARLAAPPYHWQPPYTLVQRSVMEALLVNGVDTLWWPRHLVRISREQTRLAGILRRTVAPGVLRSAPPPTWLELHSDSRGLTDPLRLLGYSAVFTLNLHRTYRAAALAITALRGGALPADQAAAEIRLAPHLRADPDFLPPLRYERLSPTRFRLGLDPAGPLPLFVPGVSDRTTIGAPAISEPARVEGWSVELDCATAPLPTGPATGGGP